MLHSVLLHRRYIVTTQKISYNEWRLWAAICYLHSYFEPEELVHDRKSSRYKCGEIMLSIQVAVVFGSHSTCTLCQKRIPNIFRCNLSNRCLSVYNFWHKHYLEIMLSRDESLFSTVRKQCCCTTRQKPMNTYCVFSLHILCPLLDSILLTLNSYSCSCVTWRIIYFVSAAFAVDSSHMTAASSASWSRFSPPSHFVNGHMSTMWFMVCRWPQSQEGDWARPHLCKLSRHGPWPVWNHRFIRDHVRWRRLKPGL